MSLRPWIDQIQSGLEHVPAVTASQNFHAILPRIFKDRRFSVLDTKIDGVRVLEIMTHPECILGILRVILLYNQIFLFKRHYLLNNRSLRQKSVRKRRTKYSQTKEARKMFELQPKFKVIPLLIKIIFGKEWHLTFP